ncbi:Ig-like domain-containing protein [Xenorhabdus bovienii]|uniref:Ig-like domain-containing protein n=1 Tax=Xenorhabdus bovienii TaxID=40576 RepID=UPI0023B29667|nr:Ig-like domain-containing protein [Xenorhabdus bovienii]MDE9518060.1 Ig-like domain-containing protein [Xenorhabdus bovienii]
MNKNSIKNLSSSSLSWNSGYKENAEIGKDITQVISLSPPNESVKITFLLDSSNVVFENNSQQWKTTTDFDGEIRVLIYSVTNTPCKFTLKAYCSDSPEISAPPLSLEFLPKNFNKIVLTVNKDNAQTNGTDTDELTATVVDDDGHPIKGVTVDFTADNGAQVSPSSGKTDKNGEIVITVTSHSAGSVKVQATERENGEKSDITVQFNYVYSINITKYPNLIGSDGEYRVEGYLQANSKMNDIDVSNKEIKITTGVGFHSTNQNNLAISNKEGYFSFILISILFDYGYIRKEAIYSPYKLPSFFILSCSGSLPVTTNVTVFIPV